MMKTANPLALHYRKNAAAESVVQNGQAFHFGAARVNTDLVFGK